MGSEEKIQSVRANQVTQKYRVFWLAIKILELTVVLNVATHNVSTVTDNSYKWAGKITQSNIKTLFNELNAYVN